MDLMTVLDGIPAAAPYLIYLFALGGVCAAVAAVLPPPKGTGWYASLYSVVNWIGINFGHARNATAPVRPDPLAAPDPHAASVSPMSADDKPVVRA